MSESDGLRKHSKETMESLIAAARIMYEGTPGMTLAMVAEKVGIGKSTAGDYASAQKWKKKYKNGEVTKEALELADTYKSTVADLGPEVTPDQKSEVIKQIADDDAIAKRAELLARHRREWAAPRAMSAEAVQSRDLDPIKAFDRAKLAKITAETLSIVQNGERKAWGLDVGELPAGSVVIIERPVKNELRQVN
jgi:hypothetical protein